MGRHKPAYLILQFSEVRIPRKQNEKVASAHPILQSVLALSDNVVSCQVIWEHRDEAGNVIGGEAGHYMLRHDGTALHIRDYTPRSAG